MYIYIYIYVYIYTHGLPTCRSRLHIYIHTSSNMCVRRVDLQGYLHIGVVYIYVRYIHSTLANEMCYSHTPRDQTLRKLVSFEMHRIENFFRFAIASSHSPHVFRFSKYVQNGHVWSEGRNLTGLMCMRDIGYLHIGLVYIYIYIHVYIYACVCGPFIRKASRDVSCTSPAHSCPVLFFPQMHWQHACVCTAFTGLRAMSVFDCHPLVQ